MRRDPQLGPAEHTFRAVVQELDLAHMQSRIEHYRSGGVKSPNLDGTSRGVSEGRVLAHDPTDARGYQDIRATIQDLRDAEKIIARIVRRQEWWTRDAPAVPDPPLQSCENCGKACDPLVREDRLRALTLERRTLFVCVACYAHGRRRGRWRETER